MTGADAALFACRFAFDAAALFLFGASAYLAALVPSDLRAALWSELAMPRRIAIAALAVATVASLPVRTALVADGWPSATDPAVLRAVALHTNVGTAWLVQAAATLLLLAVPLLPPARRVAATAALAGVLLASLAVSGHAAINPGPMGLLHRATATLHVLAAGAWLGALAPILLILRRLGTEGPTRATVVALTRFSIAGHVAVALVVLTGVANTLLVLGGPPLDLAVPYQRILALKVGLVAAMITIALANRYVLVPRLRVRRGVARAIAAGTMAEIALGAGVIALVAWFGMTDPEAA